MGVLVCAEQSGCIVGHHAGLHIPGQKFPGVLLVTGGRGAVGHGHTLRGAVCVRVLGSVLTRYDMKKALKGSSYAYSYAYNYNYAYENQKANAAE